MIAIDTNILVRVFIDDQNIQQVDAARKLVTREKYVYLPNLVLAEMVWVLASAYALSKTQILSILGEIYENAAFVVDDKDLLQKAIRLFQANNADFSDCFILINAQVANMQPLYTFDAKFARLHGVKKL